MVARLLSLTGGIDEALTICNHGRRAAGPHHDQTLADALCVARADLDDAVRQGLPALRAHNKRTARMLEAHFGLNGMKPTSRQRLARRYHIAVERVGKYLMQALEFMAEWYDPPSHLLRGEAVLDMEVQIFLKRRRFMERLGGLKSAERYRVAGFMRHTVLGPYHATPCTVAEFLEKEKFDSSQESANPLGRKTRIVLRDILKEAGIEVRERSERRGSTPKLGTDRSQLRNTA